MTDVDVIRDLAKQFAEAVADPRYDELRELWRAHNSLEPTRPLIYTRWDACWTEVIEPHLVCTDEFCRAYERQLRAELFRHSLSDDFIVEPWVTMRAAFVPRGESPWGPRYGRIPTTEKGGSWKFDPPIKQLGDIDKLVVPEHKIDEDETARQYDKLSDLLDGIVPIQVDRTPYYIGFGGDISTAIVYLRGLEQLMWDMADNPEWLHGLLGFMRDGILKAQAEAERQGHFQLHSHTNQAMPYSRELDDPVLDSPPVTRDKLWCYMAAQEFTLISPAMHDEFLLQYQLPIMAPYGLVAYGCCEDLTKKIDMLRKVPNLRRVAVTPVADVPKCAEQIGTDYVMSWRPNPSQMVCCGMDEELIRRITTDALQATRGQHIDITLKDVQTVEGDPTRLKRWVDITRECIDKVWKG
ncbi:MAG: hypothetical protein ACOCXX_05070 [Planctomycetota bacterium]